MANLVATPGWDDVYEIKTSDWVMAGQTGVANLQAQALINKTEHLKSLIEAAVLRANTVVNPIGTIKLWFNTYASIPTGWQYCDGTNGTPDLRNKFVIGAGSTYSLGQLVGKSTFSQNECSVTLGFAGSHTHSIGTYTAGSHSHYVRVDGSSSACTGPFKPKSSGGYPVNCAHTHAGSYLSGGNHYHASTVSYQTGVHNNHTVTFTCTNYPDFVHIIHIMRVS
jgi:hypothetical protein